LSTLSESSANPPPLGNKPTPVSTNPIYVSLAATTNGEGSTTSQPPPKALPCTAVTIGLSEYFILLKLLCKLSMAGPTIFSTSLDSCACFIKYKFAPTLKLLPSAYITILV